MKLDTAMIGVVSKIRNKPLSDKVLVRGAILLFGFSIGMAYMLYPHWVAFSHFALQRNTLPLFLCAMGATIFLTWFTGRKLQAHKLRTASIAMYVSALCIALVVLIPYKGSVTQIAVHNTAALFFVLSAAFSLAVLARTFRSGILGASAALQFGVCIIELLLLARYDQHPVDPWVWVVLQLIVTFLLLMSLLKVFSLLEKKR